MVQGFVGSKDVGWGEARVLSRCKDEHNGLWVGCWGRAQWIVGIEETAACRGVDGV